MLLFVVVAQAQMKSRDQILKEQTEDWKSSVHERNTIVDMSTIIKPLDKSNLPEAGPNAKGRTSTHSQRQSVTYYTYKWKSPLKESPMATYKVTPAPKPMTTVIVLDY